jgi:hypothetical protein
MNIAITFATILTLLALSDGSLVIEVPGLTAPITNHGIK